MAEKKLSERSCKPLPPGTPALKKNQIDEYLSQLRGWKVQDKELVREFKFENYYQTMSAAVAVAMLAQREDHHPDMLVSYNKLVVRFSTHSVGGLSENDFISAAKVDELQN